MPAEQSPSWLIGINIAGFLALQLGLAWLLVRWPDRCLTTPAGWQWEGDGRWYYRWLGLRRWQRWLPDGGPLIGGVSKSALPGRQRQQLQTAMLDARRGELCHLIALACTPIFFCWNPIWAGLLIVAIAMALNLPCLLSQRAIRLRLRGILLQREQAGERYTGPVRSC